MKDGKCCGGEFYRLTHTPMLFLKNPSNPVLGIECLRVDILVVNKPLDVNVDAAGDDHVGEDGVAVEDNFRVELVCRLGDDCLLHLDGD